MVLKLKIWFQSHLRITVTLDYEEDAHETAKLYTYTFNYYLSTASAFFNVNILQ